MEEVKPELRSECGGGEITPCRVDGMSKGHMAGANRTYLRVKGEGARVRWVGLSTLIKEAGHYSLNPG